MLNNELQDIAQAAGGLVLDGCFDPRYALVLITNPKAARDIKLDVKSEVPEPRSCTVRRCPIEQPQRKLYLALSIIRHLRIVVVDLAHGELDRQRIDVGHHGAGEDRPYIIPGGEGDSGPIEHAVAEGAELSETGTGKRHPKEDVVRSRVGNDGGEVRARSEDVLERDEFRVPEWYVHEEKKTN